jgi:hypothetical protein
MNILCCVVICALLTELKFTVRRRMNGEMLNFHYYYSSHILMGKEKLQRLLAGNNY